MKTRHGTWIATRFATFALLGAFMASASAQYIWLDEKGVKQFSDMPPPPSIPASRILKQPGSSRPASDGAQQETPANTPSSAPQTLGERNADFRKRRQEAAEKEKKAAEEAKQTADRAKNCERAQDYVRSLESGERISYTDKNGERNFLTDEQRASEMRDARQTLQDCRK